MPELRGLYHAVILDHNKRPHNFHALEGASRKADGYNPLCGDRVTLYLEIEDDVVRDASFEGSGCAVSQASASLLTDSVKGKAVHEAEELLDRLHRMVSSPIGAPLELDGLGELSVLAGVREFPARVQCASLAWQTLHEALKSSDNAVTMEP